MRCTSFTLAGFAVVTLTCLCHSEEPTNTKQQAVEAGRKALLTKAYNPTTTLRSAYDKIWKFWGLDEKPAKQDYDRLFRERYGLHVAPYPNKSLPMGLKETKMFLGFGKAIAQDCLICHGGSIAGKSYVGLGNASLDYQAFYSELASANAGKDVKPPFQFSNVRGTNEAGGMAVFLLGYRKPDLKLQLKPIDLELHDDLCEDVPAWWHLKKKKTMYYTGGSDVRSVRSLMQFMMSPLNGPEAIAKAEADFRNIREYLLSIKPPKYPLPIDQSLAEKGEPLFVANCAHCHGTYGEKWTYPNKVIPMAKIGTDPRRFEGISRKFGEYYAKSWFAEHYPPIETDGYQAPPLDGIWATAPYLHNGSVPTVYGVLNSKARPKIFTRSYRTELKHYDSHKLGWKIDKLDQCPEPTSMPQIEFRKIYDTSKSGRSNRGHTFGDKLTDVERYAIIEYLKTL